jgi:hypothetical protein
VNVLNVQLRTANKEWFSNLGLGKGLTIPHKVAVKCYTRTSELDIFFGMS